MRTRVILAALLFATTSWAQSTTSSTTTTLPPLLGCNSNMSLPPLPRSGKTKLNYRKCQSEIEFNANLDRDEAAECFLDASGCAFTAGGSLDLSAADSSIPCPTGTSVPGTCTITQCFQKTTDGSLWLCTATNTWTRVLENVSGLDLVSPVITGIAIFGDGASELALGQTTSDQIGFYGVPEITQPTSTTDLRVALINLGLLASGGATPLDLNGGALKAGSLAVGTSGGTILRDLTASATLNFASASANTCSTDLTVSVTNAAVGDVCTLGVPNGSVNAGSTFSCWVSASGTVTVRHCNVSAGSNDPASGTFKVVVWQQ
jgi:hypothetical protein